MSQSIREMYSRIKISTQESTPISADELGNELLKYFDSIYEVNYTENDESTAYLIVNGKPTEIETSAVQDIALEMLDCESVEVWVRRVFPDELEEVKSGDRQLN